MNGEKNISEKVALGMFVEGQYLHLACLTLRDKRVRLLDAQILKLQKSFENVRVEEEIFSEMVTSYSDEGNALEIEPEKNPDLYLNLEEGNAEPDNVDQIRDLLNRFPHRRNRMGVCLAEPQVYYSYHDSDWGLKGSKLRKKIAEELTRESQEGEIVQLESLQIVELKDGRLMAVVRENDNGLLNLLSYLKTEQFQRLPLIAAVEGGETALVNLVNANYTFSEEEVSVIVYLGHEFSRLIFMQGHDIYNISYNIGVGLDSENINHTVFSRIFLEQDNLNLPRIQNIILTGECFEVGIREHLRSKLSKDINIDYLQLPWLDVVGGDPLVSRFAVSIGSAWRVLKEKEKYRYNINLIPPEIHEQQKKLKLGVLGWVLLLALPLLAFFSTAKIIQSKAELNSLRNQKKIFSEELTYLQDIETRLNAQKARINRYQAAFGVLDSMTAGSERWSQFLLKLSRQTRRIGQLWITEVVPLSPDETTLKGYAIFRNRIPLLAEAMGGGGLKRVEVQQIRSRTVYYFEMSANLSAAEGKR